jgi:hypothetical protein
MAGGSSSSSQSKPVDMTPQAFRNLQSPFADVVASLLGYQPAGNSGTTSTVGGGTGQTPQTPQATPTQPSTGYNDGGMGGSSPKGTTATATPTQAPAQGGAVPPTYSKSGTGYNNNQVVNYGGGPTPGDPNSVISGIPSYGGQTSAPITGNEQSILDTLMGTVGSNPNATGTAALNGILTGTGNQVGAGAIDPNAVTSGFNATNNPLLQAYITSSQRATMDNLAHTLVSNGANFTANGQFIQPTGSSAFDRAQALATQSAANAASDIASNIGYNAYNLDQTLNQQTGAQNAGNVLQALLGNQSTELSASNANAGNAISAATAQGNLSSNEVQSLVQNLQAQALPRLIEQYGLDQGLQMFNNQVNDLMTILQTGAGVTSPVVANESKSSSNTKPNLL